MDDRASVVGRQRLYDACVVRARAAIARLRAHVSAGLSRFAYLVVLRRHVASVADQVSASLRLQIGLLVVVSLGLAGVLDAVKSRALATEGRLKAARSELRQTRATVAELGGIAAARVALSDLERGVFGSVWVATSPAVAQAATLEWIEAQMKAAGVQGLRVSDSTVRPVKDARPSEAAPIEENVSVADGSIIELRTVVRFTFTDAAIARALALFEGARRLAVVDSLTISAREGRVELVVRNAAMIVGQARYDALRPILAVESAHEAPPDMAPLQRTADGPSQVQKPEVEILW